MIVLSVYSTVKEPYTKHTHTFCLIDKTKSTYYMEEIMRHITNAGRNYAIKQLSKDEQNEMFCRQVIRDILIESTPLSNGKIKKQKANRRKDAIVKDCLKAMKNHEEGYVYNRDQLSVIITIHPEAIIRYDGYTYWCKLPND